ncbi:hypothetical protein CEXT_335261 [Caerostris extrusa]|uniref:Uncharacterized protein n=1 Tax=Caerostris extrusa TaxID=172846 RepID=A0AAV4T2W0_CAEEX|nr:hypothetical protein CEXT_335261 [Caerostris extrusa]
MWKFLLNANTNRRFLLISRNPAQLPPGQHGHGSPGQRPLMGSRSRFFCLYQADLFGEVPSSSHSCGQYFMGPKPSSTAPGPQGHGSPGQRPLMGSRSRLFYLYQADLFGQAPSSSISCGQYFMGPVTHAFSESG